ncbi:MAG: aldo/keto reductase [Bacteroidales bacterium]|nr:aldo/keto reductase [Candidatus Equibacterium intestinale]
MFYKDFKGEKLSALGFGTMRLPVDGGGRIDQKTFERMTDEAIDHGVNYFDTAWPYHGSMSEIACGIALGRHPRDRWNLADKYPGHQHIPDLDPQKYFEAQLRKCKVDYFDFYLMHNVCENSIDVYRDADMLEYFIRQKEAGRIRHLGFSTHADLPLLKEILKMWEGQMEFCQIQLNYLDWTLQNARAKCRLLDEAGLPIWVMEPVHGGSLATLPEEQAARLKAIRPDASIASWTFRWLQARPDVVVTLSGMSDPGQLADNLATYGKEDPVSPEESDLLLDIAEKIKGGVPCTKCRYCVEECPMELDIPRMMHLYNDFNYATNYTVKMAVEALPEGQRPDVCVGCGRCAAMCPQKIDIPGVMSALADKLASVPTWKAECEERNAGYAAFFKETEITR